MTEEERAAAARRREATRSFLRYFVLVFVIVLMLTGFTVYAVLDAVRQRRDSYQIRVEYCREIEKLKAQNRAAVHDDMKHYARNLKLLGLKDSPRLRRAAEQSWHEILRRNAPKSCPYTA